MSKTQVGKIFETNWKKSCPDWLLVYRPPDQAQSFNMNNNLRFSQRSPADFFMFNGFTSTFYALECKSVGTNSVSFERSKTDKGVIHYHQIESLKKFSNYHNVVSGFLLDFRLSNNTYFLKINEFINLIDNIDKKSFNEANILKWCKPILIEKRKLKVNYKYDVEKFLNESMFNI